MSDIADMMQCLRQMMDSGYLRAVFIGEQRTPCARMEYCEKCQIAVNAIVGELVLIRDRLDLAVAHGGNPGEVQDIIPLVSDVIKKLAD